MNAEICIAWNAEFMILNVVYTSSLCTLVAAAREVEGINFSLKEMKRQAWQGQTRWGLPKIPFGFSLAS